MKDVEWDRTADHFWTEVSRCLIYHRDVGDFAVADFEIRCFGIMAYIANELKLDSAYDAGCGQCFTKQRQPIDYIINSLLKTDRLVRRTGGMLFTHAYHSRHL